MLEKNERGQIVFRQGNGMSENAKRTVGDAAVLFRLLAEQVRQQSFGFGARLFR